MQEFPSTRELLGDLVARESHTPEGERSLAEYIAHLAERWELGAAGIHPYPPNARFADLTPPPVNVTIDINRESSAQYGEMLWFGHFDSINPNTHYPPGYQGDPYQLTLDRDDEDIAFGLKSADMAAGIVSMLRAAWLLKEERSRIRHSVRILLVGGEEGQSHGIYAALDPKNNLARGASCAISTDIEVGTKISDPPLLCIGRPGRLGLRLVVRGEGMHAGNASTADPLSLVSTREAIVRLCLPKIEFPQRDEPHFQSLMPRTAVVVRDWRAGDPETRGEERQGNMSVPSAATIDIDVINGNPALDPATIIALIRQNVDQALQKKKIRDPDVVTYLGEPGRLTQPIKPYLEHPDHTWVRTVAQCMQTAAGIEPAIKAGKGTADEGVLVNTMHIPTVILPPICEDEHKVRERVRLSSIDRNAATLRELALVGRPLTHVEYR
ncbi:MAG: M20/M25/M40 family metallo-hydrolase [Candidatus Peribacteraceae bacterium]|nr:M20/M25/M40 family metallo-hydrolase [Candidatus Peribacteraceae bacterium]MDD5742871.1 M20/M25/M40 family metallo-hydrolase [Candidatus Peribacteraceae bacterium]